MSAIGQEYSQAGPLDVADHVGPPLKRTICPPIGTAVHVDMSNEEYHSFGNWSSTQLELLPDAPEEFEWKHVLRREAFKVTRGMVFGTAGHAWLLEGIAPTIVPADFLRSDGAVKSWADVAEAFPGVPVLTPEEFTGLSYCRENCYADPKIRGYLETDGLVEHSLFSVDGETGLPTRVRLDKLCRFGDGVDLLDLKFSGGCDNRWIEQHVTGMNYYRQAGMYWSHVERAYDRPASWVFLFILNKPPFTPRLKELPWCHVELGLRHTHVALRDLRYRLDSGNWKGPGFGEVGITQVSRWKWEENPEPAKPFAEFSQFATN